LGNNFGSDGDFFGYSFNSKEHTNGVGYGELSVSEGRNIEGPVGPCITGVWDLRDKNKPVTDGVIVEDMAVPGVFSEIVLGLLGSNAWWLGENTDEEDVEIQSIRLLESFLRGPYYGASINTIMLGGMSFDNQKGKIELGEYGVKISWPNCVDPDQNELFKNYLLNGTKNLGGIFIRDPFASPPILPNLLQRMRFMVHPIGGCTMSDSSEKGACNHKGQVFSSTTGSNVYKNLYVCDGALLPSSLAVNPLFTISALAERISILMAEDNGWTIKEDTQINSFEYKDMTW